MATDNGVLARARAFRDPLGDCRCIEPGYCTHQLAAFARAERARALEEAERALWPCHFTSTREIAEWLRRRADVERGGK